jgi:hypothetical protein
MPSVTGFGTANPGEPAFGMRNRLGGQKAMEHVAKNIKVRRAVDRSPFFPGEEALIARTRKKILAARAKKEADKRK